MPSEELKKFIIKELRDRSAIPGKIRTWISELDDNSLLWLYERMRRGASSRSLAAALAGRGIGPGSSVRSMAQGITKFRKRIVQLLDPTPPDQEVEIPKGLADMEPAERLEAIERAYAQLIEQMLADAAYNKGLMTTDMAKHVTALATISKARAKMVVPPTKLFPPAVSTEFKERADRVLEFIGDDGNKMIRAANEFLLEIEKRVIYLETDPKTGEVIVP